MAVPTAGQKECVNEGETVPPVWSLRSRDGSSSVVCRQWSVGCSRLISCKGWGRLVVCFLNVSDVLEPGIANKKREISRGVLGHPQHPHPPENFESRD